MRAISGLWRWRHNPLCRATDLAEAWVALAALLLVLLVAPLAGALAGSAAQQALQRSVREQHEARHAVTATVVRELDRSPLDVDPETSTGRDLRTRVLAGWTAPDGTPRQGPVLAGLKDPRQGDAFRIWTDRHGRLVARPLDPATASTHAVLAGFGAALVAGGLVEGGRRVVVWRMVRRRYARWDQAWDRAGPDWGRTGTGS
ncbi:Rv1733c family protein [Streptomyces sp. enrichment culture]|uniref:Rv1733c family protein n=1 Tax=Streptomyces sp. enrichment culture TaxID=1795815 RepID=UPI003F574697